jgi:Ca2+-binding RTX toxin-like protein/sugar lactone lactonase YvrE
MISSQAFASEGHRHILEWGTFGVIDPGQFNQPQQIAVDDERNIYVTDTENSRIQKFTNDGEFLSSFGTHGIEDGEFQSPVGIAVYENNMYVVDDKQNNIQKFDSDGNFLFKWGIHGVEDGQFNQPKGITVDSNGIVYVADSKNHRIQTFTSDGEFLFSFGTFGFGDGKLKTPVDVAVYEDFIYVSDPGNRKIEKYALDGTYLKSFDYRFGGSAVRPGGLVADPDGNIYFVDSVKYRVVKMSPEGRTLGTFGSVGAGNSKFITPIDIVLDNRGYLFVLDSSISLIQKFYTPIVTQIEAELAEEHFKKLQELAYAEAEATAEAEAEAAAAEVAATEAEAKAATPDITKPIISAPADLVVEATGSFTSVELGEAIAMDENGIQLLVNNAPTLFPLGSSTIIWTAIDNSGNSASATQQVNIVDTTPPTIYSVPDITAEAVVPYDNIIELQEPTADDLLGVISVTNDAPEFFPVGETIVTWTAIDVGGNTASTEQKITIIDTIFPTLQVPDSVTIEATSLNQNEVDLGEATAVDNGEIVSITNDAPDVFPLGETTVTWTAIDSSNNFSSLTQLITVVDTTAPEVLAPDDIVLEADSVDQNIVNFDSVTSFDIQEVVIYLDAPDVFPLGETTVTWTAVDASGNSASTTQTVTIVDTTKPILSIPDDQTVEATSLEQTFVEIGQADAHDITGISSIVNDAPDVFPLGSTLITWTVTDNHDNITTAYQTITVEDTTAPTIIIPEDITAEAIDPMINHIKLGELITSDSVGVKSITNDKPNAFPFGSTTVTWTVTDISGNISEATQTVTLIDTTSPEIFVPADIVAEATSLSGNMIELGEATGYDIMGIASVTDHPPRFFPLGETTIEWNVVDISGNTASATQTVTIVDTTAPSITAPASITMEAISADSNIVTLGNPIFSDLVDIPSISNNAPDVFPLGETTVTWTAVDASGNSASTTQTVTIVDTTAPELTTPEDIIISAFSLDEQVEIGVAQADDLAGSILTITNDAPNSFPLGDTIVTWNVSDEFGNSVSSQQTISVQPCGKPLSYYNQIFGTPSADTIVGTEVADLIFAFAGDDMIFGGEGNDCIIGGDGDDLIFGNAGGDHLVGGEGNDILKGFSGDDRLTGGTGTDVLDGGDGFDISYDSASDIIIKCEEQL